jgi:type IV pilus assembly protein PilN
MQEIRMPIGVNLLPWREQQRRRHRREQWIVCAGAALAGLTLMLSLAVDPRTASADDRTRRDALEARLSALEPALAETRRLRERIGGLKARKAAMDRLMPRRTRAVDRLRDVLDALPGEIVLTRFAHEPGTLTIEGHSRGSAALPRLVETLRGSPRLMPMRILRLTHLPAEANEFPRFRLTLVRPDPGEDGPGG